MLEGIRVLLVDDYVDHRRLYVRALEERGATVTAAGTLQAAWSIFEWTAPDLLVSETALVDGDGYGFIRAVRALGAERGGLVPAIALTASVREEDRQRALDAGFDEHCMKVEDLDEFLAVVVRLTRRESDERLLRKPA